MNIIRQLLGLAMVAGVLIGTGPTGCSPSEEEEQLNIRKNTPTPVETPEETVTEENSPTPASPTPDGDDTPLEATPSPTPQNDSPTPDTPDPTSPTSSPTPEEEDSPEPSETPEPTVIPPGEDADGDGYPVPEDCDDSEAGINPGAQERCDNLDNNCDDQVDEGVTYTLYLDADGDGYGAGDPAVACTLVSGYVTRAGDCDDQTASVNPAAPEVCDTVDNDCDGQIDEDKTSVFYRDADGDQFGVATETLQACSQPPGYAILNTDCDDTNAGINPAAAEVCNNVDDNCNDRIDEGLAQTFYLDFDRDTYGTPSSTIESCSRLAGYSANNLDCNDSDSTVYPGANEIRDDGIDQDCNGKDLPHVDLNRDGLPDVVVLNFEGAGGSRSLNSVVYWGSEAGITLGNARTFPTFGASGACIADLNQDDYVELIIANRGSATDSATNSTIFWGKAEGPTAENFTELPTLGATDCAVDDFNADGYPDLVFSSAYDEAAESWVTSTRVYYGSATGIDPANVLTLASNGNFAVATADVNADGFADLVHTNYFSDSAGYGVASRLYYGSASGLSTTRVTALPTLGCYSDPVIVDLNLDGRLDIAFANSFDGSSNVNSYIYLASTSGFEPAIQVQTSGGSEVKAADLDGNGFPDLVFGSTVAPNGRVDTDASIYWGSVEGIGAAGRAKLPVMENYALAILDADGDGLLDLAFANYSDGSSSVTESWVYLNQGQSFDPDLFISLPTNGSRSVDAGDINGDGFDDVIFAGSYDDSSSVTEGYVYPGSVEGPSLDAVALPMAGAVRVIVAQNPPASVGASSGP